MNEPIGSVRVAEIRSRLQAALDPDSLEIIDESYLHAGHAGAKDGRGHFRIRIAAVSLNGHGRLAQQRKIYEALGDLMQTDIHAVSIQVITGTSTSAE